MQSSFELVVCISSTALFDCTESHKIWISDGLEAYKEHQRTHINTLLKPSVGFQLVGCLLKLNEVIGKPLIDVVLVSRNDAESGQRIINSIDLYNLAITCMSFTGGTDVTNYLPAWGCDLFLCTEEEQVKKVLDGSVSGLFDGIAAGLIYSPESDSVSVQANSTVSMNPINTLNNTTMSSTSSSWPKDQVRIVFDGDGVLFPNADSRNRDISLSKGGPLKAFALKLQKIRQALGSNNQDRLRTFLILSKNDKSAQRVVSILKEWGLNIDETHILGGRDMTPFLRAIDPAIFFGNSKEFIERVKQQIPAAHVPFDASNAYADINAVVLSRPQSMAETDQSHSEDDE